MPRKRPTIQFWTVSEAPDHIRGELPTGQGLDWIAIIPPELQDPEVLSLITKGPGVDTLYRCDLKNGECLLAGTAESSFDITSVLTAKSASDALSPKSKGASASGRGPGSGSQ
jgi:hypothetical protein